MITLMYTQGPRAQIDRKLYKSHMQEILFNYPNLDVRAGSAFDLVFSHPEPSTSNPQTRWGKVEGVKLGTPFIVPSPTEPRIDAPCIQIQERSSNALKSSYVQGHSSLARFTLVSYSHLIPSHYASCSHRDEEIPCWSDERISFDRPQLFPPQSRIPLRSSPNRYTCAPPSGFN